MMPIFETESRIDGAFDRLCILYPKFGLSLKHEEVIRRGLETGSLLAAMIKNPVWEYEGRNNDMEFPVLNVRGKVLGFSAASSATGWNPTVYVNIHCTLEKSPQQ